MAVARHKRNEFVRTTDLDLYKNLKDFPTIHFLSQLRCISPSVRVPLPVFRYLAELTQKYIEPTLTLRTTNQVYIRSLYLQQIHADDKLLLKTSYW